MPLYECAICQQPVRNVLVCRECRKVYSEDDPWVSYLLRHEKDCRNRELKDTRHGVVCLSDLLITSDGQTYDGWDMLDGSIEWTSGEPLPQRHKVKPSKPPTRVAIPRRRNQSRELPPPPTEAEWAAWLERTDKDDLLILEWMERADQSALRKWACQAGLTPGEFNAVYIQVMGSYGLGYQASSTDAALDLSELEGQTVTPAAFRRRLSDARRKLRTVLAPLLRAG